jgi:hypothetical protein
MERAWNRISGYHLFFPSCIFVENYTNAKCWWTRNILWRQRHLLLLLMLMYKIFVLMQILVYVWSFKKCSRYGHWGLCSLFIFTSDFECCFIFLASHDIVWDWIYYDLNVSLTHAKIFAYMRILVIRMDAACMPFQNTILIEKTKSWLEFLRAMVTWILFWAMTTM